MKEGSVVVVSSSSDPRPCADVGPTLRDLRRSAARELSEQRPGLLPREP